MMSEEQTTTSESLDYEEMFKHRYTEKDEGYMKRLHECTDDRVPAVEGYTSRRHRDDWQNR